MSASRVAVPVSQLPTVARSSLRRGEAVDVTSRGSTVATIQPAAAPGSAQERLLALAGSLQFDGRLDAEAIDRVIAAGRAG